MDQIVSWVGGLVCQITALIGADGLLDNLSCTVNTPFDVGKNVLILVGVIALIEEFVRRRKTSEPSEIPK